MFVVPLVDLKNDLSVRASQFIEFHEPKKFFFVGFLPVFIFKGPPRAKSLKTALCRAFFGTVSAIFSYAKYYME